MSLEVCEGIQAGENLNFQEEEIKQVSRHPRGLGRVKDTKELQPRSSESEEKNDKLCCMI